MRDGYICPVCFGETALLNERTGFFTCCPNCVLPRSLTIPFVKPHADKAFLTPYGQQLTLGEMLELLRGSFGEEQKDYRVGSYTRMGYWEIRTAITFLGKLERWGDTRSENQRQTDNRSSATPRFRRVRGV